MLELPRRKDDLIVAGKVLITLTKSGSKESCRSDVQNHAQHATDPCSSPTRSDVIDLVKDCNVASIGRM